MITKPEEKHLPWWKRSTAPWWLFLLLFLYFFYVVVTETFVSFERLENFKSELRNANKPIYYFETSKVTEEPGANSESKLLSSDLLECLFTADETVVPKRPPSNDDASFLSFELAGNVIKLEIRQHKSVFWYTAWIKQEYGYKGYGFKAHGKCVMP